MKIGGIKADTGTLAMAVKGHGVCEVTQKLGSVQTRGFLVKGKGTT